MSETSSIAAGQAVLVTVPTGFLGAGKTTLLNRILNGDHGARVVGKNVCPPKSAPEQSSD
jgi:hypothetical protein